jgi:hypothetical protein
MFVLAVAVTNIHADDNPTFKITTKRDDDRVDVRIDAGHCVISFRSPFGISKAIIVRTDENWPGSVVLRLHLKGLESFRVASDPMTLQASVSSQDATVRVWKDKNEEMLLDSKSPYWVVTRIVGRDGKPSTRIPLEDGFFEVTLPKAFLECNPQSITVNWIDFYRN